MMWKKRKPLLFTVLSAAMLLPAGCGNGEVSDMAATQTGSEVYTGSEMQTGSETDAADENDDTDAERIADIFSDIYEEAKAANTLGSLDTIRRMVVRLGENGYVAVDSKNQVDMTQAEQALEFCAAAEEKEYAELTIIVVTELGFRKLDLKTKDGKIDIVRGYYQYDEQNGCFQNRSTVSYPADFWQYTEEGYLIFEGSYFSDENFVLTLSDTPEHTMLRILPLDEKCREYNRKYILPVGYGQNNLFLCNWSEEDFGELDFYDLFDRFYPMMYRRAVPYMADENSGIGAVYQIPEDTFESVIGSYLDVGRKTLRSRTTYISESAAYEYRPRGFYEEQYPDIAYPEVVSYVENEDGTVTLGVNGVYPDGNVSREFSHTTVIRPLNGDSFQYVSNEIILPEEDYDIWWHSNRLTEEEWEEVYGENGGAERENIDIAKAVMEESGTEHCLITGAEKEELHTMALKAAGQVKEVYKDIEITEELRRKAILFMPMKMCCPIPACANTSG